MTKPISDACQENLKTITDALALRPVGNILWQCSEAEILAACELLPPRLLLSHGMHTKQSKRLEDKFMVRDRIYFHAGYGFLPAAFIALVLFEKGHSPTVCWSVLILLMLGLVALGYWRGIHIPSRPVLQTAEWLDFTTRTLHTCTIYPDSHQPLVEHSLPFSRLILVCFCEVWDDGRRSHEVALCEADRFMDRSKSVENIILTPLHKAESEQSAASFALKLAQRWNLPAWQDQFDIKKCERMPLRLDTQKKRRS